MPALEFIIGIAVFLLLLVIGYFAGTMNETKHYRSIKLREQKLLHLPTVSFKNALDPKRKVESVKLVSGNVVVSIDYFKRFLASLKNIFGGTIRSYETMVDRGRREAVLRMKESATGSADIIINLRIETSVVGNINTQQKGGLGSIEILAYGTAIKYQF